MSFLDEKRLQGLPSHEAGVLDKWCEVLEEANCHRYLEHLLEETDDFSFGPIVIDGVAFGGYSEEEFDGLWALVLRELEEDPVLHDYASSIDWRSYEKQ
jgi:hypothetical protein